MIIRQTPKNLQNYIGVDSETSLFLTLKGFYPKYMDFDYIYYVKTDELQKYIEKENIKCKKF